MHPVRTVLVGLLVSAATAAMGQESALQNDPVIAALGARATHFLDSVSGGQTQSAYQDLLAGSPLLKQAEALKTLVSRTVELEPKYGRYRGCERIGSRRVGNDLVLLKYLYKCDNYPVLWYFTFYRTPAPGDLSPEDDTWRVITVRFDTELDALWY